MAGSYSNRQRRHAPWAAVGCACVALLAGLVGQARADGPPWVPVRAVPLPDSVRSLEVVQHDMAIQFGPSASAARRGSTLLDAHYPILGWTEANADCQGRWFLISAEAWLCEVNVRLSARPPQRGASHPSTTDGLPYRYYFVSPDGSFGYQSLRLADEGIPDSQLEPGFAVALRRVEAKPGGSERYGLTTHGLWVPLRELRPANPSHFEGRPIDGALGNSAWIYRAGVHAHKRPSWSPVSDTLPKLTAVSIVGERRVAGTTWLETAGGSWLRATDVRRPEPRMPPANLRGNERWIHVDTETQTLVAYEGKRPVFATLVSTGKGATGSAAATPRGTHRIWVKLRSTDMTNLEDVEANRYYAMEEVPWVMFFKQGYGLHGAYWHDSFGNKRSQGCINLSPKDAEWLFHWAGPTLPSGWHAVHPAAFDPGTLVVID